MIISIDYLKFIETAIFIRVDGDQNIWSGFYHFLGDYIPIDVIDFDNEKIEIPWRFFLSYRGVITSYFKSHSDCINIRISDDARSEISKSNNNSYSCVIKKENLKLDILKGKLRSKGFMRILTDNQLNNLSKIGRLPNAATFSVPGAGKTTEALAFFFLKSDDNDKLLVIAPKNAFGAWDEQLSACTGNDQLSFSRLRGGSMQIAEILKTKPKFMLITYEQFDRVSNFIKSNLLGIESVFVFLDESHRIKGGKNAKRADSILDISHLPKSKLIMSGTPMPQSPKDLVSQFMFLYPEKNVDEFNVISYIQPIYVRTTKGQLGIPEVTHIVRKVRMSSLQREIYDSLKSEAKRELANIDDISASSLRRIGKCIIKILQFVSNPSLLASDLSLVFDRKLGELLLQSDGPKIDYVCKRARELAHDGKKVIIWSSFVRNVELLSLRLSDLGAEYIHGGVDAGEEDDLDTREGKIKRFHSDDDCKVLVANPAACSEGISLHKVCQNAIYLDRNFNCAQYLQSEDRIHRLGLSKDARPVVEFVECENSIDQLVRLRLEKKINAMSGALNDTSLKVEIDGTYEEESDDFTLNADDAKVILDYFFGENYAKDFS